MPRRTFLLLAALLAGTGCGSTTDTQPLVEHLSSPAGPGSAQVRLTKTPSGAALLSWVERPGSGGPHELRIARLDGDEWAMLSNPASGSDWFVNWADFPSVAAVSDSLLYAHFLRKAGASTYAYHVMVTRSDDGGRSWSEPFRLHTDSSETEHGFVSLLPMDDQLMAIWLDGREMAGGHGGHGGHGSMAPMTLRAASFSAEGHVQERFAVDRQVCDCCQTAAVRTDSDVVVAYRDRSEDEIRDIYVSRFDGVSWSEGFPVGDDGWHIPGCPVNGPAMDGDGERIAIAWFTAAGDEPRVQVAFSDDGGRSFSPGQRIDDGHPLGRVDIAFLPDGAALALWVEEAGERAKVRARKVTSQKASQPFDVSETSASRASGFPSLQVVDDDVLVAWISIDPEARETRAEVSRIRF